MTELSGEWTVDVKAMERTGRVCIVITKRTVIAERANT